MDNTISTENMYFAAALISYGAKYLGADRQDRMNQAFKFNKDDLGVRKIYVLRDGKIEEVENPTYEEIDIAYTSLSLCYPPNIIAAIKQVKAIIHQR